MRIFNIFEGLIQINILKFSILIFFTILLAGSIEGQKLVTIQAIAIYPTQNQLDEGAFWDLKRQTLWFIDIEKGEVHWFKPDSKAHTKYKTGQKIGTVVPAANSLRFIMGVGRWGI